MLGLPDPLAEGAAPRDVVRFSHLERHGPRAGDPVQRLVLPEGLAGACLTGRAAPGPAAAAPAGGPTAPPVGPVPGAGRGPALRDLDSDPRGVGVLLPDGYVEQVRVPAAPRSAASRSYKVYLCPDGSVVQSRAEAWRHHAAASRGFQSALGGNYAAVEDGSPGASSAASPGASPLPPQPDSTAFSPDVAQPNSGRRARMRAGTPSAQQP